MNYEVITSTDYSELGRPKRGKVRDIYDLDDQLLIVATDRLSAFDVVFREGIPLKGIILTQLSLFWFQKTRDLIPNHVVTANVKEYPQKCSPYLAELQGRSMIVKKAVPIPIESVVRGHISGSAWNSYLETSSICGIPLPPGLSESERLPEPIFTPATKEEVGAHDINISIDEMKKRVGASLTKDIENISKRIFAKASEYASERGLIIADTKMEFGLFNGELMLIDELLTPDSSRFWSRQTFIPGKSQPSYDKQFVRDYLTSIGFNKQPPPPPLPDDVIQKTSILYQNAFQLITGKSIDAGV